MSGFNPFRYRFPYTNINDINLDWIIKQVKQLASALQGKQDKPDSTGTAGQVLGLDSSLNPVWVDQSGGGGGTTNYNSLENKPQINSVTLTGNKSAAELGLAATSDIPVVPVQSVNGQTGAVVLDASSVGALPSSTFIPTVSLQLPLMDGTASAGSNFSRFAMEGHVHPTDTTRQAVITASGLLKGAGSGTVQAATKGVDYGAKSFTITLASASWSNNAQTVGNADFYASGYSYIVSPAGSSFADYAEAVIYADNVTVDGSMTFHCTNVPTNNLTVNVQRSVSA